MKAALFIGSAILLFGLLLAGAFAWDCSSGLQSAMALVEETDRELSNTEERVITALGGVGIGGPQVEAAISRYHEALNPREKREAFAGIMTLVSSEAPTAADPSDPIRRRAADEYAGSQNRRQIALRHWQDAVAAYNATATGFRGRIGVRLTGLPTEIR